MSRKLIGQKATTGKENQLDLTTPGAIENDPTFALFVNAQS